MKTKTTATTSSADTIVKDLRDLLAEAEKIVGDNLEGQSEDVLDSLRARLSTAQERLAEIYADTRKQVITGAKHTDETIRTHPYESLAVAAGIGLLVGLLVGRGK